MVFDIHCINKLKTHQLLYLTSFIVKLYEIKNEEFSTKFVLLLSLYRVHTTGDCLTCDMKNYFKVMKKSLNESIDDIC